MLEIKLVSSSKSDKRPVTAEFITDILANNSLFDSNELIRKILESVQKKSSKHKFLVNITKISSSDESECTAGSNFGAAWDNASDGYFTFELQPKEHQSIIVSVYWIYIG